MHLEQILKNLPLGVGTPYQKTGLKWWGSEKYLLRSAVVTENLLLPWSARKISHLPFFMKSLIHENMVFDIL